MDSRSSQLSTIALFCKAAELGSFTSAANALGVTPAAVSRGVGRLEDRLGTKLFRRTTRSMSLTEDGKVYFEQCRAALGQIEEAESALTGQQGAPSGLLRISAPSTFAIHRLLPRVRQFRGRFPDIKLDINIVNRNIDFVEEGYDVAIRMGTPPDSRLIARKLEDAPVGIFGTAAYFRAHGKPKNLQDLLDTTQHTLLPFVLPSTGKLLPWIFMQNGQPIEVNPKSSVQTSDEPLGCVALASNDVGLVQTFRWIASSYEGKFFEVMGKFSGRSRPFYLLYPQDKHLSARVRAFVDFLVPKKAGSV
jgi:DNA-binding transcriptional LysR family regulator